MEVIASAEYGTVLASDSCVYYVPTKTPPWQIRSNASTEEWPALARTDVHDMTAVAGETVEYRHRELLDIDGALSFTGKRDQATQTACDWALIEELVGPLRYREDVEQASMYRMSGTYRPRIPLRVVSRGLGAVAVYLSAHGHRPLPIKNALALTYAEQCRRIYKDVYEPTTSFEWDGFNYE